MLAQVDESSPNLGQKCVGPASTNLELGVGQLLANIGQNCPDLGRVALPLASSPRASLCVSAAAVVLPRIVHPFLLLWAPSSGAFPPRFHVPGSRTQRIRIGAARAPAAAPAATPSTLSLRRARARERASRLLSRRRCAAMDRVQQLALQGGGAAAEEDLCSDCSRAL